MSPGEVESKAVAMWSSYCCVVWMLVDVAFQVEVLVHREVIRISNESSPSHVDYAATDTLHTIGELYHHTRHVAIHFWVYQR